MRLKGIAGLALVAALIMLEAWLMPVHAQGPTEMKLTLTEFAITPATFSVQAGQTVRFTVTNAGKFPHNVTFELPSQKLEQTLFAPNLQAGETKTAEYTFPAAGDWEMYCPVDGHEDKGMKGTVTVTAAAGGASAAPAQPAANTPAQPAAGNTPATLPVTGGEQTGALLLVLGGLVVLGLGVGLRFARTASK